MSEEEFKSAQAFIADPANANMEQSNETKLEFYALFKQATTGPATGSAPSRLRVVERAKWMAWKSKENLSKEEARAAYIALLNKHSPGFSKL